jgi:hypothetical protein
MEFIKENTEIGNHYLYGHFRLDTNNFFYIGIGTKYNHDKDYTRAKAKGSQRNSIWRGIVERCDYNVIILFESDDYNLIKQKEIELITKHGQIIKNNGLLCNLTNGGDGMLGVRNKELIKPVYVYSKSGKFYKEFEAISDCTKFLKTAKSTVALSTNKNFLIKGFIIKDYKVDFVDPILNIKEKLKKRLSKKVHQYDKDMNFIKEWDSSSEVSRVLNISGGHIREICNKKGNRKTAGGFIWKYF